MRTLMASGDGGAGGDALFAGGGGDTQYLQRHTVAVPLPGQTLHTEASHSCPVGARAHV